jgi:hypothetical protein
VKVLCHFNAVLLAISLGCSSNTPKLISGSPHPPDAGDKLKTDAAIVPEGTGGDPGIATNVGGSSSDSDAGLPVPDALPCNGTNKYCDKKYDELCYAATHDSAAQSSGLWQTPSQSQSVHTQLDNGIRALTLSVQTQNNLDLICYGDCTQGNANFKTVLKSISDFMSRNAREVVTLLIDSQTSAANVQADFVAAGLDTYVWTQPSGTPWPTLREMIDANRRLVVFADTPDQGPDWMLPRSSWVWETGSNWSSLPAMNCNPAVGDASRPFYLVHHYVKGALVDDDADAAAAVLVSDVNDVKIVAQRLSRCLEDQGRIPNFVAVDYFEIGDPVGATQVINGIRKLSP